MVRSMSHDDKGGGPNFFKTFLVVFYSFCFWTPTLKLNISFMMTYIAAIIFQSTLKVNWCSGDASMLFMKQFKLEKQSNGDDDDDDDDENNKQSRL